MKTHNDELVTTRDFRRAQAGHLERLEDGDVEKLVLMKGTEMRFVLLPVRTYENLTEGTSGEDHGDV